MKSFLLNVHPSHGVYGVMCVQSNVCTESCVYPHKKPFGIRRVSNPSTSIDPGSLKIGFLALIH